MSLTTTTESTLDYSVIIKCNIEAHVSKYVTRVASIWIRGRMCPPHENDELRMDISILYRLHEEPLFRQTENAWGNIHV